MAAMASRSARDTTRSILGKGSSSSTPGPGSYGQSILSEKTPNFAAFASSTQRTPFGNDGGIASTPGPGSYVQRRTVERRTVSSSAFKTSASRMCPSAPGSTVFVESSVVETPGPGEYHNQSKTLKRRKRTKPKCFIVRGRFNPPAIPVGDQSHGYDEGTDGQLIPLPPRRRQPQTTKPDDEDDGTLRKLSGSGGGFSKSTTRRHVFETKQTGPGPGDYSPSFRDSHRNNIPTFDGSTGRSLHSSGLGAAHQKSCFLRDDNDEDEEEEGGVGGPALLGPSEYKLDCPSVLQCFGSTSERSSGWARPTPELLHTEPTSFNTPGPGSYACETTGFHTKIQKRLTNDPIPFNSSGTRPSLKATSSCLAGPGEYNLEAESIATNILKRKAGRFPSSIRFSNASATRQGSKIYTQLLANDVDRRDRALPGPGQYDIPRDPQSDAATRAARGVAQRAAPVFRSNVARPGTVLPRVPTTMPGVGDYTIPTTISPRKSKSARKFTSQARRFDDYRLPDGAKINDSPGPGAYKPAGAFRRKTARGTPLLTELRFRDYVAPQTSPDVGPGAYVAPGSCLTKSHNVSYTTEKSSSFAT